VAVSILLGSGFDNSRPFSIVNTDYSFNTPIRAVAALEHRGTAPGFITGGLYELNRLSR